MDKLVDQAFSLLYPDRSIDFVSKLTYSKAFRGFNANVRYTKLKLEFRISYSWKDISDDIKIGLLQSLLNKVFKTDIKTMNIELYEIFLSKLQKVTPVVHTEGILSDSFNRMNQAYFNGLLDMPNLVFGKNNFHTLGTYTYQDDTIMISRSLLKDMNLLDYVMYHEMLHKKLNYKKTGKRTVHHSKEFRELEKQFEDKDAEKKLKAFVRRQRFFSSW